MARLWEIEAEIRGQGPETRMKARQGKSAAFAGRFRHNASTRR
jgi:hypothetical protein